MAVLLENIRLSEPTPGLRTFPVGSRIGNSIILVSPSITVERVEVLDCAFSDHLPLAMHAAARRSATAVGDARSAVTPASPDAAGPQAAPVLRQPAVQDIQ